MTTIPLVDERLGVVTRLVRYQPRLPMPPAWVGWSAHAADTRAFADWEADRYGFGASLGDDERARRAAVGEVAERYCGNAVPADLEITSFARLVADGRTALDPASFSLYSARQYATRGFPFTAFTADLPVAWVPGRDLRTGAQVMAPASMVYLNYFRGPHATEPATHSLLYAGIAAGEHRPHAEQFALEELFERDANTIWWASGTPPTTLTDADDLLDLYGVTAHTPPGWRIRLLAVPTEFDVPVVAAYIEDQQRGILSYGTSCRADPHAAAVKAVVEALAMWELTAQVAEEGSAHWQAVARGEMPAHTWLPYRADRRYADDIRPDFRDLVDLPPVAQLYLDPRMQKPVLDRIRDDSRPGRLADLPQVPADRARHHYLGQLHRRGMRAVSVDVTTPDVRAAGLTVVRVLAPGLYGNPPAAFPYLGGRRLYDVPAALGLVDRPLDEHTLYPYPIPHV